MNYTQKTHDVYAEEFKTQRDKKHCVEIIFIWFNENENLTLKDLGSFAVPKFMEFCAWVFDITNLKVSQCSHSFIENLEESTTRNAGHSAYYHACNSPCNIIMARE